MESQEPYLYAEMIKVHYPAGICGQKRDKAVSHLGTPGLLSSYESLGLKESMLEKKGYRFWNHTHQDSSLVSMALGRLPVFWGDVQLKNYLNFS